MFDFEKLDVYRLLRTTNVKLLKYLYSGNIEDRFLEDQLKRAAFSVSLNLAEGVGRTTKLDKRRFITMSRSSLNEVVSILQIVLDLNKIDQQ